MRIPPRLIFPLYLFLLIGIEAGLVFWFGFNAPYWNDESHFVATVRLFGDDLSFETLKTYDDMQGPFLYVAYALWGRVVGFETGNLRMLSLLIGLVVGLLVYRLHTAVLRKREAVLLSGAVFLLNPYAMGTMFFVYSDMVMVLFMILLAWAVYKDNISLIAVSATCGLLTRQYFFFMIVAAGLFYLLRYLYTREKKAGAGITALAISGVPLALLFVLWGGPASPVAIHRWAPDLHFGYYPNHLTLYIAILPVYLLPVLVVRVREFFAQSKHAWMWVAPLSLFYLFFPVRASQVVLDQTNIDTVGLFHKLLEAVWDNRLFTDAVFFILFVAGLFVVRRLIVHAYEALRERRFDYALFLEFVVLCFLLVMPFSYAGWEKYLMPVIPIAGLRVLMEKGRSIARDAPPES